MLFRSVLAAATREAAAAGQSVIADATFLDPAHAALIRASAGTTRFLGVWLTAPVTVLEARIAARSGDASDATIAVLRAAVARGAAAPEGWITVSAIDRDDDLAQLRKAMRNSGLLC